ncbi:TPR-like protein, partial [Rhizophagus irregularis]
CLNNYEQAHLFLKEAIDLNPKRPVAYFICGEIFFRQNEYDKAINYLNKSMRYKKKINNSYILLGNSHLLRNKLNDGYYDGYYEYRGAAIKNYNIALKNDPNNYLCLKKCAYAYVIGEDYSSTLNLLDKLLNINKEDSLVLCYYGEILYNMTQYRKAISYFTKAYTIDPENIHNLNRRAITYYIIKEYDKVLSDLDKIIQLDPLNSSAYYLKSLTYYTKNDINNAKISFKEYAELSNSNNTLAKIQLCHLEYLLNKNSSKVLKNILTKISQVFNYSNYEDKFLQLIRCKIYIELKEYSLAKIVLDFVEFAFIGYFIQDHPYFRSYLYEVCEINKNKFTTFGIVSEFSKYMYKEHGVYLVSNLTNLNSELCQFQESDISSLSGLVLSSKNENLHLGLPIIKRNCGERLICKMNVKKILSNNCFITFILNNDYREYCMLNDLSKIEGLGWIEYRTEIYGLHDPQFSIETNSIEMQIEYIRFGRNPYTITQFPNISLMGYLSPVYHKFFSNVPETFKDKYFSRKEMENLLDLKDILNSL